MTRTTSTDQARAEVGLPAQGKELEKIEQITRDQIAQVRLMTEQFADAMRSKEEAKQLVRDMITALRTNPELAFCTRETLLGCGMTTAQLQMRLNVNVLGHCWAVPFRNNQAGVTEAQFILGYRGMVELGRRSGISMIARTVWWDEPFEVEYGLNERLYHVPVLEPDPGIERIPRAHYCIARSGTAEPIWVVMSHQECLAVRAQAKSYKFGGPRTPWRTNPLPMCRKTTGRRLFSWIATQSPQLALGFAADESVRTNLDKDAIYDLPLTDEDASPLANGTANLTRADITVPAEEAKPETKPVTKAAADRGRKRAEAIEQGRGRHREGWQAAMRIAAGSTEVTEDTITDAQLKRAVQLSPEKVAEVQQDQAMDGGK